MRLLKYLLLLILLIPVVVYFAANYILDKGSQEILALAKQQAQTFGIQLDEFEYDSVSISSLRSVTWYDVNVRFRGADERFMMKEAEFKVQVSELTFSLVDYASTVVQVSARDFTAAPTSQAVQNLIETDPKMAKGFRNGSIEGRVFEISTAVDLENPVQSAKPLAKELFDIAKTGGTTADIRFEGKARMHVRGSDLEANVLSVKKGAETRFVLDRNDVARISETFDDKLTGAEINIIADHPAKAPLLFTIKDYAESKSNDAFASDNTVPQDPYRHVLWSYLLTKEFGPEFAEVITDAHEEGPTGNTPMERRQDYNNNAVGRQWAADGVQENEILQRVRTDPKVMRQWNRGGR